ncbi:hypothetical protein [Aquiflexum lacus]|uniref:hypothetical protein n=1 Tax=Aquiflexum lacus TaxID=2483805 RepID=UPI0018930F2E|nr:hypothetical protein [Aquiflexum lacus]
MSKIVDRIGLYAENKNISIRRIEQEIGASNGTLSKAIGKGKDILSEWVSLFANKFTDVNPVWLITGQGEMLLSDAGNINNSKASTSIDTPDCSAYKVKIAHLEELLKMHQEKNKLLEDLVEQLKSK